MIRQYWQQLRQQLDSALAPAMLWYRQREEREQLALQVLAVVFGLLLVWLLLWRPVAGGLESAREEYQRQQQVLMWIQDNAGAIRQARARQEQDEPGRFAGDDWINVINATAGQAGVSLAGFTPEGNNAVRISLEGQEFASVIGWFQRLESDYGVHVGTVDLSAGREPGTVSLRATLKRS